MRKYLTWILFFIAGGLACWGVNAAVERLSEMFKPPTVIAFKSITIPLAVWLVHRWLVVRMGWQRELMKAGVAMVLGIWFFGPFDIIFLHPQQIKGAMAFKEMLFYIGLFPLTTLFVSVYSGAIGAVLVSSTYLIVAGMGWFGIPGEKGTKTAGRDEDALHNSE